MFRSIIHATVVTITVAIFQLYGVHQSQAYVITNVFHSSSNPPGAGTVTGSVITQSPGNDNWTGFGGGPVNVMQVQRAHAQPIGLTLGFSAQPYFNGTGTEYLVDETIVNNTGMSWIGYEVEIVYPGAAGLFDLDFPDKDPPPSSPFSNLTHSWDKIVFWGGVTILPGESIDLVYCLDTMRVDFNAINRADFTKGTPRVVPVPAALWLFGSGLIGLLVMARRKR